MKKHSFLLLSFLMVFAAKLFGQSDNVMINFPASMTILKGDPPSDEPKNLAVHLVEIFMGECGNQNNCHHEPVAGRVVCELFNGETLEQIHVVGDRNEIWQSNGHDLVCDNLYAPREFDNGEGIGRQRLGTLQFPVDNNLLNNGMYFVSVRFNLGVNHQDNPFASVGGHWLARGDDLLLYRILLDRETILRGTTIGPFQSASDRCHEFWLRLNFGIWDRE